jgi:hypothetical protein
VLTSDNGSTYAGGVAGGTFDGRGVVKWSHGDTDYCELAAGKDHGYSEFHYAGGGVYYYLYERGKEVHSAYVYANGSCGYDRKSCGADHVGHVALKDAAQKATVRRHSPRCSPSDRAAVGFCARRACARAALRGGLLAVVTLRGVRACARARVCRCMHARGARTRALLCVRVHWSRL